MQPDERDLRPKWLDAQNPRDGRYVLGPLLGQGGMGEVREAWDVVLCRSVALKILRKMDPVSLLRFLREAQAQSRVAHPNICQIYDVDSSEGAPRISMQLVRGPTLADAAADLTVDEIVQIMVQVCGAVHAAHRMQLIHRDLKPSNILLDRNGEGGWTPYVCDFGLAIGRGDSTLTAPQWINGTPAYMAPEQVRGDRAGIGPATDVFALGGTLRFALRGGVPDGGTATRQAPARPAEPTAARAVPRALELIMLKCLDPAPELRYPSAAALAEDLARFRNGEPVQARPAGFLGHLWRRWRRAWKPALACALAAGALAAGLALERRHQSAARQRRAGWARAYTGEADAMERELSMERMLPLHDLRPAYAALRSRLEGIRTRLAAQGPEAQGPGHYALGRGRLLLGEYAGALEELEQAWAAGFREPGLPGLQVRALVGAQVRAEQAFLYAGGLVPPEARARAVARAEALVRRENGPGNPGDDYLAALVTYLRGDYGKAAAQARVGILGRPWQSARLESLCLTALGRQGFEAGDDLLAEARYGEAMEVAQRFLEADPSDEPIRHAYLLAARGLAQLMLDRKQPVLPFLRDLQGFSARAFQANPEDPELQDDWLAICVLQAMAQADLGQDPDPGLRAALAFLGTRAQPPLTVELRADRMLLQWQRAEWAFRHGRDPGPALAQALADPGHTPFLGRDYLGEVLNFKAEVDAAQGRDPRPALGDALARMEPLLAVAPAGSLCRTAAAAWLIRARWEASHNLDARYSLGQARALTERAVALRPAEGNPFVRHAGARISALPGWRPAP